MRVLDGRPIAVSGSRDATLRVWDIEKGECLHLLSGHEHSVRCIEVSGNKVVSGSYDATCRVRTLSLLISTLPRVIADESRHCHSYGTSILENACMFSEGTFIKFMQSHSTEFE